MNPFEKIFNYQVMSRLHETGTLAVTSHERTWLKAMLEHPASEQAFTPETLEKLQSMLEGDPALEMKEGFGEKAKSREQQVYHPLLRPLRRLMARKSGILINHRIRDGRMFEEQPGFPFKLEYSMVKREWYLIWYHLRHRALMNTRLQHIVELAEQPVSGEEAAAIEADINRMLEGRKESAVIEVVREYNNELSRILYAFSCFEKQVGYDDAADRYTIRLTFLGDESEYVLSKLRFLGKRVRVVEGDKLKRRMRESAAKALSRYGVTEEPQVVP